MTALLCAVEAGPEGDTGAAAPYTDDELQCREAALSSKQSALDLARADLDTMRSRLKNLGTVLF